MPHLAKFHNSMTFIRTTRWPRVLPSPDSQHDISGAVMWQDTLTSGTASYLLNMCQLSHTGEGTLRTKLLKRQPLMPEWRLAGFVPADWELKCLAGAPAQELDEL